VSGDKMIGGESFRFPVEMSKAWFCTASGGNCFEDVGEELDGLGVFGTKLDIELILIRIIAAINRRVYWMSVVSRVPNVAKSVQWFTLKDVTHLTEEDDPNPVIFSVSGKS
jgi:hypothetical protein